MMFPLFQETPGALGGVQLSGAGDFSRGSAADQNGQHRMNQQLGRWQQPPEGNSELPRPRGKAPQLPAAQLAQEEAELAVRLLQVRQRLRALEAEPSGVASTSAELQSAQQAVGRALRRVATAHAQPPRQRPPDGAADGFDPRSNSEWHEMHGAPPGRQAAGRRPVGDGGFGGLGLGDVLATATPSPPKVARPSTQAAHGEGSSAAGDQREAGAAHSRLRASAGFRGASLADVLVQPPRRPVLGRVRPRGGYDGGSSSREGSEAGSRRESRDGGAHSRHAPTGQQDDAFGGLSLTDVFRPAPHSTAAQETDVPRRRPMRAHPSLHGQQSFLEDLLQSGTSGQRPFIRRASEPSAAREPASVLTTAGRQHGSGGQLAVAVDADGFPVLEALQDLSAPGRRKSAGQGRAAIALLEKFTYSEATFAARRRRPSAQGSEHPECSICLDAFNHQQQLRGFSGCGHCFHERCISEWFSTGDTRCPNCRWDPMTNSR
ncbi:hypothetical protein WJX72_001557 [[Myrmecia] bisecta]|uniref:RING-type domain-containing protein n=1 Tax=[Myrmecia] bisecta TaxID=41462 RepID=A0AAW1PZR8_9CHLO